MLKRDSKSEAPYKNPVTDITEVPCSDKYCMSVVFVLTTFPGIFYEYEYGKGIVFKNYQNTLEYQKIESYIVDSDRGSQYTCLDYKVF